MYSCTHWMVYGQLIIDGVSRGIHGFMVQFRNSDGLLMPGVEIGEIGPKLDTTQQNIGYARFTHVRIPRFNMFAKNARVTHEGEYIPAPPKLSKFGYVAMMNVR